MTNRHALLIGVPRYDEDEFNEPHLADAVRSDLAAMRAALEQSGYHVTERGTGDEECGVATRNHISKSIEEACANVPVGGVLLIYFSGHGITVNGRDHLLPSDAYRSKGVPASVRGTVPVLPDQDVLDGCQAALVTFFVDACRNNDPAGEETAAEGATEPGGQQPYLADNGQFVLVMGCGAGQVCQYDETGSAFTQALAQVLDPGNPARTLAEVVAEVAKDMERRSRQAQGTPQGPAVKNRDRLTLAGHLRVCDGDELTEAWRKAVVAAVPLLARCDDPERVHEVIAECARRCRAAAQALAKRTQLDDPWTDPSYPARVLKNAELLLRNAGLLGGKAADAEIADDDDEATPVLRSGEAALLLAAPFLREAVLAVGIREAAAVDPADLSRTYETGPRGDLELTHEMHQHLVRRAEGLRRQGTGQPESAGLRASSQLAMWLVHRWLADRGMLWQEAGATEVCALGAVLVAGHRGSAGEDEELKLVQTMLLAIGADPVDKRLVARLLSPYVSARWRMIGAVLWLAGIMAADPRRLPPVVADLVGTGMELPLREVQTAAGARAKWVRAEDGVLDLHLACNHPALHDAFEDIVRRADRAATTIKAGLGLGAAPGGGLPRGFTHFELRPSTRQDEKLAYQVPLARFQIAEEKVRELLMGRQLYGDDPALAIRELYQNALDACRWRATRQEYRRIKHGDPVEWSGRITFTQGTDNGRPFIECTDNGVGMDLGTLEHVFGNAGERFVYRQEFRAEQAAWEALNPPLRMVSNSQFGVGVFSYFMLADEMTVRTRHHHQEGLPDREVHEVRIASSGSLFQIQQIEPTQELRGGGTQVRLYLSGEGSEVSVLRTLRDLLWISEFKVEVFEGEGQEAWEPGKLRYPEGTVPTRPCGDDLWWITGEGGLAADGIRTNEQRFGVVVNLRAERRPQFTVDRRRLEGWNEGWVRETIEDSLPELMEWPGFTLSWLWRVADSNPAMAQQIFEHAVAAGKRIRVGVSWGKSSSVALGEVGCLPDDLGFFGPGGYSDDWLAAWRTGIWRHLIPAQAGYLGILPAERVTGFPVPDPIDALLINRISNYPTDAVLVKHDIIEILSNHDLAVASMLRRLRRFAIIGLNLAESRFVPAVEKTIREDDAKLLPVLVARSLPGETADKISPGPLMYASFRLDLPLGEVLRRAECLAPETGSAPSFDLAELRQHTCTETEASLLTRNHSAYHPLWFREDFTPAHLARATDEFGSPLSDIIALCDKFAPLGVTVAMRDAYPQDLQDVESYALSYAEAPGQLLSLVQLVLVAGRARVSVGTAHAALARLEHNGLIVRPELNGDPEFIPIAKHLSFIEDYLLFWDPQVLRRSKFLDRPFLPVVQRILGHGRWADKRAAHDLVPFVAPCGALGTAELAQLAYSLEVTLSEAARKFGEIYPGVPLPDLDPECSDLTVDYEIRDALLSDRTGDIEWRAGPRRIIAAALFLRESLGDFLSRLDPFRSVGAYVPVRDEKIREVLNQAKLDDYDDAMLAEYDEFGEERDLETISPLTLVRIAGRFGWTLSHAHGRLARLVPVGVKLEYPVDAEIPEEIVYWYDLLVLTRYFDGQEPAVSGGIDGPYLRKAAVEIFDCAAEEAREKVAFLRGRLGIYAGLFQLELPEENAIAAG